MKFNIEEYPYFLRHDIEELVRAEKEEKETGKVCWHKDCLQDELYGSISSAYYDRIISKEEAEYLRITYLGIYVPMQDL